MVEQTVNQENSPVVMRERRGSVSSECSSIPSPRTHNRSVSHDSYFNLLERSASNVSPSGAVKEERESDTELSPESSKIFLDISELNLEFNTSEAEMKIFSEDDTLKSTSIEDTLSRSTVDIDENVSIGSDVTKSKENVSSREKRSLKDKLKKRFTSPSAQRKETNLSDSSEDSRSNSLKRASSVIKDIVQALSPETSRKKGELNLPHQSSPVGSPKVAQEKAIEKETLLNGDVQSDNLTETLKSHEVEERPDYKVDEEKGRASIESALIDPELLDKITRMRISPTVSTSEASSVSLAEATVSDNESFTLGSSSNTGSNGVEVNKEVVSDSGSTLPQSLRTTPCTPPVTIVADPHFQEEISKREASYKLLEKGSPHKEEEGPNKIVKPLRDRPNSLLGISMTDSCGLGSSLTSPETPQGDSTFLEIQYHPLSDTTEPSTPSESHFIGNLEGEAMSNPPRLSDPPRQSSPLSPDLSSSSADDPIENGPLYENIELTASLSPNKLSSNFNALSNKEFYDSSSKVSPEVDTPTAEESELEYENIQYNTLEQSYYEGENDSKLYGSNSVTPCYENLNKQFPAEQNPISFKSNDEIPITYENIQMPTITVHKEESSFHSDDDDDEYEDYYFQEQRKYENVDFTNSVIEGSGKTAAEIEGEVVYQQVKYLRRSVQEVNEMLNETSDKSPNLPPLQSVNLPLCQSDYYPHEVRKEENVVDGALDITHASEGSECLDSPVTPSSSSLVTEVLVLPSFSSPTESTTEDGTSPDASESQSSPKLNQVYPISPNRESPTTVTSSPNSSNSLIPTLSPPSPELSAVVPLVVTSTYTKTLSTTLTPSPWPRSGQKQGQVWPPVPKPRNLPSLNVSSLLVSPSAPSSSSPDSPLAVPELLDDQTPTEEVKSFESSPSQLKNVVHIVKVPSSSESDEVENKNLKNILNEVEDNNVESSEYKLASSVSDHSSSVEVGPHPPHRCNEDDEVQKRERIEKYKEERRSVLREKYKSESFKGEKDDMLLRLKQKATSPSRQEEVENLNLEYVNKEKERSGPVSPKDIVPDNSEIDCVFDENLDQKKVVYSTANLRFQSSSHSCIRAISDKVDKSVSGFKIKSEPLLHRSISEDSKVLADRSISSGKETCSLSSTNNVNTFSSTRTSSDSTFQSRSECKGKTDEDINVKERVAIWNRHEGSSSVSSQKRDCVNTTVNAKVTPPKLRKIQTTSSNVSDLPLHSKPIRKVSSQVKSYSAASSVEENGDKATSPTSRIGRSQPYSQRIGKGNGLKAEFPPLSPVHKVDKNKDSPKTDATSKLSTGKSCSLTVVKKPTLVSQKSESDLREPVMLKTRSYSVGTGLGASSSNVRSTNSQQKRIKDIKALFEKPTSREGIGN